MRLPSGRVPVAVIEVSEELRKAVCVIVSALSWKDKGESDDVQGLLAELVVVWWLRYEDLAVSGPPFYKGPSLHAPVDIVTWRRRRRVDIGVRSKEYGRLAHFNDIGYPAFRIDSDDEKLPNYIVATSVDGSSVAIWGAIHRRDLIRATADETPLEGHPAFYSIALDAFSAEVLECLLRDAERAS